MRRSKLLLLVVVPVLLTLLAFPGIVVAGLPGGGWWSFYQVQNVGGAAGTLQMEAYATGTGGDTYSSNSFSMADGAALAFHPGLAPTYPSGDRIGFTTDLADGFQGSAVLMADVPIVAVTQIGNNTSGSVGSGGTATSFYQGIGGAAAADKVSFPTVKHNFNGQTTTFYVQAAGEDAQVTITYNMNDGSSHTQSTTIEANRMFVFDPANASTPVASSNCGSAATSPCMGAATVSATTGSIVGVVVEHPHQGSPAPFVLSTRGFTSADEDTTIFAPTIKNDFNSSTTGFSVQNVGTLQTTAYITLTVTNASNAALIGQKYYDSEVIAPGSATVFSVYRSNLGGMPAGTFASAVVSADQNLVGAVNESKSQANTPDGKAKAVYAAFPQSGATSLVALPLVKELFNGKTTGVTVVNAGDSDTKFVATYTDANGAVRQFETTASYSTGEAAAFFQVFQNPQSRFTGLSDFSVLEGTKNSVVLTTSNGEPLIALAQESDRADKALDIKNYEGFNLVPTP
jgi:hypothetical protein